MITKEQKVEKALRVNQRFAATVRAAIGGNND